MRRESECLVNIWRIGGFARPCECRRTGAIPVTYRIFETIFGAGVQKGRRARYSRPMTSLTASETAALERAADAPMLAQVETWAAVNSGTGNLPGLKTVAGLLADAYSARGLSGL